MGWENHFDAGVKSGEKALDYVIRLAFKDGYDKGFSAGMKAKEESVNRVSILTEGNLDNSDK